MMARYISSVFHDDNYTTLPNLSLNSMYHIQIASVTFELVGAGKTWRVKRLTVIIGASVAQIAIKHPCKPAVTTAHTTQTIIRYSSGRTHTLLIKTISTTMNYMYTTVPNAVRRHQHEVLIPHGGSVCF